MDSGSTEKKDIRHAGMLYPSSEATVDLVNLTEHDFNGLCDFHPKTTGNPLEVPKALEGDFTLWRTMIVRYMRNDFRHNDDEAASLKVVAQWILDTNNTLRNQPVMKIGWRYK